MKFKQLANAVVKFTTKNSPYILSGVGATAITVGTVVIVKKAKKQETLDDKVLDNYGEGVAALNEKLLKIEDEKESNKVYRREITKLNIKKAAKYVTYYLPPVALIAGGVFCMFSATLIQTKRLKALSAAYTTLAAAFNEYRDRVKAVVGEEKESDIFHGIERDEKGEIVSEKPLFPDQNTQTFSRLFGDGNSVFWSKDPRLCLAAIKGAESNINNQLRDEGFVTLNDLWKALGMRPSEEGMYIGWRWIYGDPVYGSTYISLGYSGPKNEDKCEILRHGWNEEMWIDVTPPHVLFGKVPKEILRTDEQKRRIKANRRKVMTTDE